MSSNEEVAVKLFKEGYNCSQAVLLTYCEKMGVDRNMALKLSSSFGGGMGRLREVCGAVSAMFMVAGLKYGYIDPEDKLSKQKHYELIQLLSQKFKEQNGSIVCRELLGLEVHHDVAVPDERTEQYYKKRPCADIVKNAAQIIDEFLDMK